MSDLDPQQTTNAIALVLADLLANVQEGDDDATVGRTAEDALNRIMDLGGIEVFQDDDGLVVNPMNLLSGSLNAMAALFAVTAARTGLTRDELVAAWREELINPAAA